MGGRWWIIKPGDRRRTGLLGNEQRHVFPLELVGRGTAKDTLQLYRAFLCLDETRNPPSIKVELNRIGIEDRRHLNRQS